MKALIFNIQNFSLHDGPGIRTTVFFKGCPLYCAWCSNPESKSSDKIDLLYNANNCFLCQSCVNACPNNLLLFINGHISIKNKDKCQSCKKCANSCISNALRAAGDYYTPKELFDKVMSDKIFFETSNGGVTLSGGEPLMNSEFVIEFLKLLKEQNIHTTLETCGYTEKKVFESVLKHLDLLYFDLKHTNNDLHKEYTGVSNKSIIANLKYALDSNMDVVVRIPVIPNFNFDKATMHSYAVLLNNLGAKKVHLLPFHQFGEAKYAMLNIPYKYKGVKSIENADLEPFLKLFEQSNISAQIGG